MTAHRVLQDVMLARSTHPVDVNVTSFTLTALEHAGRIVTLSHTAAASTVTLPAATGSGAVYKFIVAAVNTSGGHIVKVANSTDVFVGGVLTINDTTEGDVDGTITWYSDGSDDTITLDGTTTGGVAIGDSFELVDYASGKFQVHGRLRASGSEDSPFSATV